MNVAAFVPLQAMPLIWRHYFVSFINSSNAATQHAARFAGAVWLLASAVALFVGVTRFTDFICMAKGGKGMKSPSTFEQPTTPRLPPDVAQWSTRGLAAYLGVSASTVKYHARQMFRRRSHTGRWEFNPEQAQRVANHIYQFGQRETLCKGSCLPESKTLDEG